LLYQTQFNICANKPLLQIQRQEETSKDKW